MDGFGLLCILLLVLSILCIILFERLERKNKKLDAIRCSISSLNEEISHLRVDKRKLNQDIELLRELIFFREIGENPTKEQKQAMLLQIMDNMQFVREQEKKHSFYRTENALRQASQLGVLSKELNSVLESFYSSLKNSSCENASLYPLLCEYIKYCGLSFCGKKIDSRSEIKEVGRVVYVGHIEE